MARIEMSSHHVHRRRRAVAVTIAAAALMVIAIGVGSATGGAGKTGRASAVMPSPVAREWAGDAEARRKAVADREAVETVLRRTPILRKGAGRRRLVALTFDDGPSRYTPEVLEILDRYDAPATFFAIGGPHEQAGIVIKEILRRGHAVANHTVNHPALQGEPARSQAAEIDGQSRAIEMLSGAEPRLFRPPYNSWDGKTLELLERRGMLMVLWSVESNDWAEPGAKAIARSVLENAHPGAIVVLHDGGGDRTQTVAALPAIIGGLRDRGYELVTVPELLREDPPQTDQSR